jgi:hypothetical protein
VPLPVQQLKGVPLPVQNPLEVAHVPDATEQSVAVPLQLVPSDLKVQFELQHDPVVPLVAVPSSHCSVATPVVSSKPSPQVE